MLYILQVASSTWILFSLAGGRVDRQYDALFRIGVVAVFFILVGVAGCIVVGVDVGLAFLVISTLLVFVVLGLRVIVFRRGLLRGMVPRIWPLFSGALPFTF